LITNSKENGITVKSVEKYIIAPNQIRYPCVNSLKFVANIQNFLDMVIKMKICLFLSKVNLLVDVPANDFAVKSGSEDIAL
jgi:hypothetical protein